MAEVKNEKSRKDEAKHTGHRAAAAAHNYAEASRETGDTRRRGAEEAGEASRRGAEEVRATAERAVETASDIYARSAQETTQGLEAAVKYSTVLASGMQTLWHEWIGCAQDVVQRNMDGVQNLMRSRSPSDFFAAQSDLLRDEVQAMIDSGSRLSEVSARIASDAARVFGEQFENRLGGGQPGQRAQSPGIPSGRGGQQPGGTSRT
ncbi:MAG: phasin family protein [Rhodospirillales bacterium]|nr:phasin family protein [Rhodospirillales bacterium]